MVKTKDHFSIYPDCEEDRLLIDLSDIQTQGTDEPIVEQIVLLGSDTDTVLQPNYATQFNPANSGTDACCLGNDLRGTDRYIYLTANQRGSNYKTLIRIDVLSGSYMRMVDFPTTSDIHGPRALILDPSRNFLWVAASANIMVDWRYYDFSNHIWSGIKNIGSGNSSTVGIVHTCSSYYSGANDNYFYRIGRQSTNYFYRYDYTDDVTGWVRLADLPWIVGTYSCGLLWQPGYDPDKIYAFGGDHMELTAGYNKAAVYSISGNNWVDLSTTLNPQFLSGIGSWYAPLGMDTKYIILHNNDHGSATAADPSTIKENLFLLDLSDYTIKPLASTNIELSNWWQAQLGNRLCYVRCPTTGLESIWFGARNMYFNVINRMFLP